MRAAAQQTLSAAQLSGTQASSRCRETAESRKIKEPNQKEWFQAIETHSTEASVLFSEHSRSAKPAGYAEAIAHSYREHGA